MYWSFFKSETLIRDSKNRFLNATEYVESLVAVRKETQLALYLGFEKLQNSS